MRPLVVVYSVRATAMSTLFFVNSRHSGSEYLIPEPCGHSAIKDAHCIHLMKATGGRRLPDTLTLLSDSEHIEKTEVTR